jgi:uncharacterized repeat protein (TIGR03837 family)
MAPKAALDGAGWAHLKTETGQIQVRPWHAVLDAASEKSDVWIEAFGCELPDHFVQWAAGQDTQEIPSASVWLNLEYMSAESYVERSHKLPSPAMSGPLKGRSKWFFYPGFTEKTGGLLREKYVQDRLSKQTANLPSSHQARPRRTSLFCYEPEALVEALQLDSLNQPDHEWQVAHGRGAAAFDKALLALPDGASKPSFNKIPPLPQAQFDDLLETCDLNFVRGEDSLVRALWAGKALIWHIYPQDDGAHAAKLEAFLDWLNAPPSLRQFHLRWNGLSDRPLPEIDLMAWQSCIQAARRRLMNQPDLVTQLLQFVAEKG